jgi:hypothetical protein
MENPPHVDHFCHFLGKQRISMDFHIQLFVCVLEGITCASLAVRTAQGKSKEAVNGRYDAELESGHFVLLGEPS